MGEPSEIALRKDIGRLDEHCRAFIARSPFVLLATADLKGRCDVGPKGDAPGFVLVLDDRHLLIPDRPGNKRFDGMRNLLENPGIGLIFLVQGSEETLRSTAAPGSSATPNGWRAWPPRARPRSSPSRWRWRSPSSIARNA
jgi:hypothetical protein